METILVDARGEQCPIPVVRAIKALDALTGPAVVEVHVDNETAVGNVTRLAETRKLGLATETAGPDHFILRLTAGANEDAAPASPEEPAVRVPSGPKKTVVAVSSDAMGSGNDELGRTLMKGFLYALSQLEELPETVLFYNGGAKLTTEGSLSLEDLRAMEERGVRILTCGTCLNYYGLTEKLAVGSVTNMYAIVEALAGAGRVIRP